MDEYMISAWNGRVGENDDVYIAGDLIFRAGHVRRTAGEQPPVQGRGDAFFRGQRRKLRA
jgi:calcineurin-like phosphoesterase family protein